MSTAERHAPSALLIEAASLFYLLGGPGSKHLVIVGGMVPPLLVPEATSPHLGSSDIDLCLSVAFVEGETRQYYDSIQELIDPYFRPLGRSGFRWVKRDETPGLPLLIDFLSPEAPYGAQLADGTRELEAEVAAGNTGVVLRPYPIRAGALIDKDAVELLVADVPLVYRERLGTVADVRLRHAGPVGFLAAKADALDRRDDTKDGYDVAWWCVHAADSPPAVAERVLTRPGFNDELFQESIAQLLAAFKSPRHPGPTGYAAETNPGLGQGDEAFDRACNEAFAATRPVIDLLRDRLW